MYLSLVFVDEVKSEFILEKKLFFLFGAILLCLTLLPVAFLELLVCNSKDDDTYLKTNLVSFCLLELPLAIVIIA